MMKCKNTISLRALKVNFLQNKHLDVMLFEEYCLCLGAKLKLHQLAVLKTRDMCSSTKENVNMNCVQAAAGVLAN